MNRYSQSEEKFGNIYSNLNFTFPITPKIPLLGVKNREKLTDANKEAYTKMFTETFLY